MVKSIQYPHELWIKSDTGSLVETSICRDQPNDRGVPIDAGDGRQYVYASLIYCPLPAFAVMRGDDIEVIGDNGEVRLKGEVKRVSIDEFHVRLWV